MEKINENSNSINNKNKLNINLTRGILEYVPNQSKFLFLEIFRWNNILNKILESLLIDNTSKLTVINSHVNHPFINLEPQISTEEKEKDDSNKNDVIPYKKLNPIKYFCPKDFFITNNIINSDGAKFIYALNKKLIRNKKNIETKKLKYYILKASSKHDDQCITNVAKKNSNLYGEYQYYEYWSSYPSEKDKSEYIIIKIHPGISMISSIHAMFYKYGKIFKTKYITVSFGLIEDDYYFTSDKIEMNKEAGIKSNWIHFNTSFLANYVKIQFFDKMFQQYDNYTEDNYYIVLEDLNFFGIPIKDFDERIILYDNFAQKNIFKNIKDYYEILLLLDKNKFIESDFFKEIRKEFDMKIEDIKNNSSLKKEIILFLHKYHKFIKIHPLKNLIEKFIKECMIDQEEYDSLIEEMIKDDLEIITIPKFKVFRDAYVN